MENTLGWSGMEYRPSWPTLARLGSVKAAFLGLFASSYLLYAYVAHQPIVCGSSSGCEMVRLSKWAYVFGTIPRPFLGVAFYAFLLILLVARLGFRSHARLLWRVSQVVVAIGVIESVILFFIQWREIGAFCTWCLLSALASVALGVAACLDKPVQEDQAERRQELRLLFGLISVLTALFLVGLWMLLR